MAKILLVEDEKNISSFIERGLSESGHEVTVAFDGQSGFEQAINHEFDLLLLDIIMPKKSGLELCEDFRKIKGYHTPIILLTALGTTDDIVKGLDAGADDYIVKPFSFLVLEARIKALLRRKNSETEQEPETYSCGNLTLDPVSRRAIRKNKPINLTVREYRLLEYLITNQGVALSRSDILKQVWDKEPERNMNVVDVYVNYLRAKIDKDFKQKLIKTVVGVGYMMEA